ncbi:MAG: hypothetical protein AAGB93_00010 [Planctomycetota bacterium]
MRTRPITRFLALASLPLAPAAAQASDFERPVELTADGAIIDVGADVGHAGPLLRDHDGDGRTDLLVSSFRGTIEVFRNVGTNERPAYESQGKIGLARDGATALKFHNW